MKPLSQRLLLCGVRSWCHVVQDVVFESVAPLAGGGAVVADACTTQAGELGELWNVTMVVDDVPPVVNLTGACPRLGSVVWARCFVPGESTASVLSKTKRHPGPLAAVAGHPNQVPEQLYAGTRGG